MFTEIGHFALVLALSMAIIQAVIPMVGAIRNDITWMVISTPAAIAQFLLISIAFAALIYAFITSDFSVLTVVQYSHTEKPMLYKISGVWGNHEGSMLLWIWILAIFGAAVALFKQQGLPLNLKARVQSIQSMISCGFILFTLFTSNPFERVFPPEINGQGLNPLLQDPSLALHPPLLYLGYVGFSVAFSFAVAALIEGKVDATWARWVKPWILVAWIFLTIGIALGSWWAYYELGWGGWWFWDPVENASFMPWLVGTALLHSVTVVEKRDNLKAWTLFLAIVTFSLSLLGTFLVRSGILSSVHAFAIDPTRGVFILLLLLIVTLGSLSLFAWRAPSLMKSTHSLTPISREGALLFNNLSLSVVACTILLGTLYPLFSDAFGYKVSVGAPFFNSVFIPLMIPAVFMMAIAPLLLWQHSDLLPVISRLKFTFITAVIAAIIAGMLHNETLVLSAIGLGLSTWLIVGTLTEFVDRIKLFHIPISKSLKRLIMIPRTSCGMTLSHTGLALVIAGMTGAGLWKVEKIQMMQPGDTVTVSNYIFTLDNVEENIHGPNYTTTRATFTVHQNGEKITTLHPEKRSYLMQSHATTEAAIRTLFWGDLYAVIGDRQGASYITRLYWNPLVAWMWVGVFFMVLGGISSLSDRRFRIGVKTVRTSTKLPFTTTFYT